MWQTLRDGVRFTPFPSSSSGPLVAGLELAVVGVFIPRRLSDIINQGFSPLGCWFINIHQQRAQFFLVYISFGYHVAKGKNISLSLFYHFRFSADIFKYWVPGMPLLVRLFPFFLIHSLSYLYPKEILGSTECLLQPPGAVCRLGLKQFLTKARKKKSEFDCNCAAVVDSIKVR